jgi:hypothetical protein
MIHKYGALRDNFKLEEFKSIWKNMSSELDLPQKAQRGSLNRGRRGSVGASMGQPAWGTDTSCGSTGVVKGLRNGNFSAILENSRRQT